MNGFGDRKKLESNLEIQNVYSNFTKYLAPGETEFTVENPNKVRDGINRIYRFGYLDIVPEYVSEVAEIEDMDDEEENKNEIKHVIRVDVKYLPGFNNPADETRKMSFKFAKGSYAVSDIISILNSEFDSSKPQGMEVCPAFLDWTHPTLNTYRNDPEKFRAYMETNAPAFYDDEETFEPLTHKGYLPKSITRGAYNDWKFPTEDTTAAKASIRIMLMPLFAMRFSNNQILTAMGYDDDVIGLRGKNNQYHLTNQSKIDDKVFKSSYLVDKKVTLTTECTVSVIFIAKSNAVNLTVKSSVAQEKKISKLVERINDVMDENCEDIFGYSLPIKINSEGKVEFGVVSNEVIEFKVEIKDRLAKLLKFHTGVPITSTNNVGSASVEDRLNINAAQGLQFSEILVLDTGPLTVTLKDCPSLTARGRADHLMAFLRPKGSISKMDRLVRPPAEFPMHHPELTFKIDRNSDRSKIIGLSWPVGCNVNGLLVGSPI